MSCVERNTGILRYAQNDNTFSLGDYFLSEAGEAAAGAAGALGVAAEFASLLEEAEDSMDDPDDLPESFLVPESLLVLLSVSPEDFGFAWL